MARVTMWGQSVREGAQRAKAKVRDPGAVGHWGGFREEGHWNQGQQGKVAPSAGERESTLRDTEVWCLHPFLPLLGEHGARPSLL
jgi:hypothetical protein